MATVFLFLALHQVTGAALAHALLGNYLEYEGVFLAIVAVPAVIGEFALTLWLLFRAGDQPARSIQERRVEVHG